MIQPEGESRRVELQTALGRINVVQQAWTEPINMIVKPSHYWLQFISRLDNGRACFTDRWDSNRFEPLGRIFMLPAHHAVHLKSSCRRCFSVSCDFPPQAIERWFNGEIEWTDGRLKQVLNIADLTIHTQLLRLSTEVRTPGFASETLAELISAEIVIELARYCLRIEEPRAAGGLAPWRMRLIDERLAEPGDKPSLIELAGLCDMSARQLTRAFRVSRGCSIGHYIVQSRIDHAKRLLRTDQNIESIAPALGFGSSSSFYFAFHRVTGETPSQFRQRLRRGDKSVI